MSAIFCFADACSPLCCPVCMCKCVCVWVGDHVLGATAHQFSLFISLSLSHSYYTTPLSMQCIFKDVQIAAAQLA